MSNWKPNGYNSVIMIGGGATVEQGGGIHLHLYVNDVQAAYKRAIGFGAESIQEPARKTPDDDFRAGVYDRFGTTWWLASQS